MRRLGRLLAFLGRLQQDGRAPAAGGPPPLASDGAVGGIGVDQKTALLVEPSGQVAIVGSGTPPPLFSASSRMASCPCLPEPQALRAFGSHHPFPSICPLLTPLHTRPRFLQPQSDAASVPS